MVFIPLRDYERFARQNPDRQADAPRGIRNNGAFGVLKLTLHPNGYDWQFVPGKGKTSPILVAARVTKRASSDPN